SQAAAVEETAPQAEPSQQPRAAQRPPQRQQAPRKPATVQRQMPKVGRNDPCPCGSGKKYKQCHGKPQ
ncbi:MAG: SEC-C metal-binding domain-containing protein, partial [Gammaproteobacteria bacterium]|nr:SEC-C metal-binding domain-containing protein [Gammaproteobacteria bacterium]